ncbi:MAG TPA: penicillin-binding protein [Thermotogota bacterium]|nr:penicillin-binding protein [Thermotogota bacterium]NLZ13395.1 transpeptidase family protein [Thermotogaceae bacterium]HNR63002.1 penicillin-binding protein [Thermotogota bacterium]HNT95152.1 penicillin-binding protein [Thermotogota bacterium]HOZ11386.1 penicillin-binding protein [Thermotogota bacterium]
MNEKRVNLVTAVLLVLLVALLVRGLSLSISRPDSSGLPVKNIPIFPQRGLILDTGGTPLVMNAHKYFYYLDTKYYSENLAEGKVQTDLFFEQVRDLFQITREALEEKMRTMSFILLGVSESTVLEIPRPAALYISIDHRDERSVLYPELAQIIGKVDSYGSGVNGLERAFDPFLASRDIGQMYYERFSNYARLGEILSVHPPVDGQNLRTTIDLTLQQILSKRLHEGAETYGAKSAMGVLIEAKTGKVRALYSTTGLNDAIISVFEPGSALKPFIFASAMKYDLLADDETFLCTGKIKPYKDLSTIINDTHVHHEIQTTDALAQSCNVATIEIALRFLEEMDNWTWYKELRLAGFGSVTGVEYPGEVNGILHNPVDWNRLTGIQMSIGQGIAVTALQLTAAFNIFANNGIYLSPTLLEERANPLDERRVYPEAVVKRILTMLHKTVLSGTATAARSRLTDIAGKTGTAQKAFPGMGYVKGKYVSSFIGFFPVENPMYTMLISLDEPQGDIYYGGDISAPIFKNIVEDYLTILEASLNQKVEPILFKSWKLPDFKGLTRKDAMDILAKLEIPAQKIRFEGEGVIISQRPADETPIHEIDEIVLILGRETDPYGEP